MSTEIVAKVSEQELSSEHITFTPYGVEFTENERPTIEEWHKAVLKVQNVHGMTQFYLGDLIVFAESEVTGWGEKKYDSLIDATGYDYHTLANFAMVSRIYSSSFREQIFNHVVKNSSPINVSFNHFRMLAPLMRRSPEHAKYFLEMVRDGRWTVSKLREEIVRFKNNGQLPDPEDEEETPVGYETFKNFTKQFFKGYVPNLYDKEYTERDWLIEIRDVVNERLNDLGVA